MRELAGDQVSDGDQMPGGTVAAGLGLGGLDDRIDGFDPAVGEPGVEGVEDSLPVILEGLGDPLEGFEAAAARPLVPALEQRLRCLPIGSGAEDLTQRLFDPKGRPFKTWGSTVKVQFSVNLPSVRDFRISAEGG